MGGVKERNENYHELGQRPFEADGCLVAETDLGGRAARPEARLHGLRFMQRSITREGPQRPEQRADAPGNRAV